MKRHLLLGLSLATYTLAMAQPAQPQKQVSKDYRTTSEKINDLVHTKLDARFDYAKSQLNGKAWITLKPHFYATDSLTLDAKGMDIKEIAMVKGNASKPLKYEYDAEQLRIKLDKTYKGAEPYTIYINYTAKPDEYQAKGSAAITDAKGLYFINPRGEEKGKPTQIWTQGETEANSVWVPTIDKPNQKMTDEILMTVPDKYVTLSNGKLVSQKKNADGTRTDDWKMELPHAPYLLFMGVGDYAVVKDKYGDKEVSYYVEKEYAPVARKIFGYTPEMIAFYSRILGVDFPWAKYSQIVGRDYVSGAMENTTATLHQESAQQDARQLTDGNAWESVIAHELFHQWFGDLVTTESWSNLTLNESFANYSEYLWDEYKYGKDAADEHNYTDMQGYLNSGSQNKDLVRFQYNDKEDMFDAVSYNKGGRILHMLRKYVGDSAFFKSLNLYLTTNKFKSAEVQNLRLAFEEVTGKDLNPFFNQWYYGSGNPKLNITYSYNNDTKQAQVIVEQTQTGDKIFNFPVAVDVWNGTAPVRYNIVVKDKIDTFSFAASAKPALINFDAAKTLLAQKTENKTLEEYLFQYQHANNYVDRREAVDAAAKKQAEQGAVQILSAALSDKYDGLRKYAINKLDLSKPDIKTAAEPALYSLAQSEKSRPVKAAAISKLGDYGFAKNIALFKSAVNDSSYTVAGNALEALSKIDSADAVTMAKSLAAIPSKGKLKGQITKIIVNTGDPAAAQMLVDNFNQLPLSDEKLGMVQQLTTALTKTESFDILKSGVDAMISFKAAIPQQYQAQFGAYVDSQLKKIQAAKVAAGAKAQADYISSKLPEADKKGF